jgi:hypothetical protein
MIALLLRLYPARWRTRYGDEFATLLGERSLGPFDIADVLLGALDAHLHLRGLGSYSEHRRGFPMSLRLGGFAAMVGGALWFAGLMWSTLDPADQDAGAVVAAFGAAALLVGLAGLSAFQARRHPVLVWAAFALPAVGGALATLGLFMLAAVGDQPVAGVHGWALLIIGVVGTIAGSLVFAVATYRTAALPRSGAVILGVSAVISLIGFVAASGQGGTGSSEPVFLVAFGAFAIGWIVLGLQAIRLDRPVMATGAGAA